MLVSSCVRARLYPGRPYEAWGILCALLFVPIVIFGGLANFLRLWLDAR